MLSINRLILNLFWTESIPLGQSLSLKDCILLRGEVVKQSRNHIPNVFVRIQNQINLNILLFCRLGRDMTEISKWMDELFIK